LVLPISQAQSAHLPCWCKGEYKAPVRQPTELGSIDSQQVVSVSEDLESQECAQICASAIKWELTKSGDGSPSDNTTCRVPKRKGSIQENSLPRALNVLISPKDLRPTMLTQTDLLGPRHIRRDGGFYLFNLMNV